MKKKVKKQVKKVERFNDVVDIIRHGLWTASMGSMDVIIQGKLSAVTVKDRMEIAEHMADEILNLIIHANTELMEKEGKA